MRPLGRVDSRVRNTSIPDSDSMALHMPTLLAAIASLASVSLVAGLPPTLRAIRVGPVDALRTE